jgi:uncharacterized membrane protein YphA (DoxX/SURF4 family)
MLGSTVDSPSPDCATSEPTPGRLAKAFRALCLIVLAAVFLMSGASKLIDPAAFADRLVLHDGLPPVWALGIAAVLPWLELVCGLCLALGYTVREAAAILGVLLVALLGYSLFHLGDADCHCFFFPQLMAKTPWWWPPLRNLLLLVCSIVVARR